MVNLHFVIYSWLLKVKSYLRGPQPVWVEGPELSLEPVLEYVVLDNSGQVHLSALAFDVNPEGHPRPHPFLQHCLFALLSRSVKHGPDLFCVFKSHLNWFRGMSSMVR